MGMFSGRRIHLFEIERRYQAEKKGLSKEMSDIRGSENSRPDLGGPVLIQGMTDTGGDLQVIGIRLRIGEV